MIRIGQKLANERQKKGYSLSDIEQEIKIKASFISAIEKGDYQKLPSPAYAQGFVKNYIQFLGLPEKETMAMFRREFDQEKEFRVLPETLSSTKEYSTHRFRVQRRMLFVVLFVVFFLLYLLYQYRFAIINPPLTVVSPKENSTIAKDVIVTGTTDENAVVTVNNNPVSVDENGDFAKRITIFPGETTITVTAKNRLNRATTVTRHVTVSE